MLHALRLKGYLKLMDLRKEVNCSRSAFYGALAKLRRRGYIQDINKEEAPQRTISLTEEGMMVEVVMEEFIDIKRVMGEDARRRLPDCG